MLALDMLRGAAGAQPTLDLNFTSGTLDSRVTYSGASLATLTDATGAIAYKPHNLLLNSVLAGGASGSPGAAPTSWAFAFNGGSTTVGSQSVTLAVGSAGRHNIAQSFVLTPSTTYTLSFNLTAISGTAGDWFALINVPSGSISGTSFLAVSSGTGAKSLTFTAGTGGATIDVRIGCGTNANSTGAMSVTFDSVQLNIGPLQPYYPTTSAAYYGPRFTYDPVTHAALGLLIEGQRTNLLLQSGNVGGASWTTSGALTVTQNAVAGPMGGITATRIQTSGAASVYQNFTVAASTAYTVTFYALNNGGTLAQYSVYDVTHAANIFAETTYLPSINGSTWTRVTVSFTTPAGCVSVNVYPIRATGSGVDLYLDCAQLEAGAFATSYIPTTSASVTRAADSATMTGSNFSSWFNATQGTFVVDVVQTTKITTLSKNWLSANDASLANRIQVSSNAAADVNFISVSASATQANITGANLPAGSHKIAARYAANDFALVVNGTVSGTDVAGIVSAGVTQLNIGTRDAWQDPINNCISRLRYYNTALTNAQLQALTT